MSDNQHAIDNARGWAESIAEAIAAYRQLDREGAESVTYDGEEFTDSDALRERIEGMPLSIEVRDGWRVPGAESEGPEEFAILLSTGGPALRIYGEVDSPGGCELQWQDWGTPWTDYRDTTDEQDEAIVEFVGMFYLGEDD